MTNCEIVKFGTKFKSIEIVKILNKPKTDCTFLERSLIFRILSYQIVQI